MDKLDKKIQNDVKKEIRRSFGETEKRIKKLIKYLLYFLIILIIFLLFTSESLWGATSRLKRDFLISSCTSERSKCEFIIQNNDIYLTLKNEGLPIKEVETKICEKYYIGDNSNIHFVNCNISLFVNHEEIKVTYLNPDSGLDHINTISLTTYFEITTLKNTLQNFFTPG